MENKMFWYFMCSIFNYMRVEIYMQQDFHSVGYVICTPYKKNMLTRNKLLTMLFGVFKTKMLHTFSSKISLIKQ